MSHTSTATVEAGTRSMGASSTQVLLPSSFVASFRRRNSSTRVADAFAGPCARVFAALRGVALVRGPGVANVAPLLLSPAGRHFRRGVPVVKERLGQDLLGHLHRLHGVAERRTRALSPPA